MAKAKKTIPKKAAKVTKKPAVKAKAVAKAKSTVKSKPAVKVKSAVKAKSSVKAKPAVKVKTALVVKSKGSAKKPGFSTTAPKKSESYFKSYLKPLDDRIVVLVGTNERVTAGGLIIPDTVTDVSGNFQGKVMAIGRGHMNKKGRVQPLDVSVGDKVVFSQFSGSQIDLDGNNIMIIRESDVLGIVK